MVWENLKCIRLRFDWSMDWEILEILVDWSRTYGHTYQLALS